MDGFQHQQLIVGPGFMNEAADAGGVQRSMGDVLEHFRMARGGGVATGPRPSRSYSQVSVVYAVVKAKADALAMLPLMVSTVEDEVLESGPLVDLAERPNEKMTGRQFRRHTSAHLDLFGRVHWWLNPGPGGLPVEVVPINPLQMTPKRDTHTGELLSWKYRPAGRLSSLEITLPLEEVHTIIDPDFESGDPLEGLSPRKAAAGAIAQYFKADSANESSLDNGMEPSGVFSMDGMPRDEQVEDLRHQINERHTGVRNRNRYLLLYGGLRYEAMGQSFGEMEFPELKRMSGDDICSAFGVPPSVIGRFTDSNYAHAESAEKAFWIKTILPLAARLAEEWDLAVISRFEGDRSLAMADAERRRASLVERTSHVYRRAVKVARRARTSGRVAFAWFDSSDIPAVQQARLGTAEQAERWNRLGVPLNAIIAAVDAPFEEVPWGDTWHKPIGLVDVQEDSGFPGGDDPSGAGETDLLDDPAGPERGGGRRRSGAGGELVELDIPERTRARLHDQWRASWSGVERGFRGRVRRHFNEQRKATLRRLDQAMPKVESLRKSGELPGAVKRDVIGQILFDLVEANEKLLARARPLMREAYRLGGEQSMQEAAEAQGRRADDADPFDIDDPRVAQKLRQREVEITNLNRRQQRRLRQQLEEGMDNGESLQQLSDRIKTQFNQVDRRAATIARTEVGAAVEEARAEGRRQAGVPLKSWLSSRKEHGRPSHLATERVTMAEPIEQDEDFVIDGTGVRTPHPRATGLPEHDINCGCTTMARFPSESARSMVARYQRGGFLTYEQMLARDKRRAGKGEGGGG